MSEGTVRLTGNGVYVVETVEEKSPPAAPPEPTGLKCANCDRRSTNERVMFFSYKTKDGFKVHNPCCKCGHYVRCPDCEDKYHGCPECGEKWEYT